MPFNAALAGLQTSNSQLRVLSNNIANASTSGFKRSRAEFRDVFAAGTLGSGANTIGTGVKIGDVSQQFTQGIVHSADTSLDLAVNGSGFFVLDKDGSRIYSRSGAFRVDKDGFISNSQRQNLIGFLTDVTGKLTGAQGPLKIANTSLDPNATTAAVMSLNLDGSAKPPEQDFVSGFTPTNPPNSNSYNNSASTQIFDSLGGAHTMTTYFTKAPAERAWRVFIGIDGVDVTPQATPVPLNGTPTSPAVYTTGSRAAPFTVMFDTNGKVIANNPGAPPLHYGTAPVLSADNTAALVDLAVARLPKLDIGDLTINGIPINVGANTDTASTAEASGSVATIADAINAKTEEHKVIATKLPTVLTLQLATMGTAAHIFGAGDFVINGVPLMGPMLGNTLADLVTLINTSGGGSGVNGIKARITAGNLELYSTVQDGRNIQIETNGTVNVNKPSFIGFDLQGGTALNKVKRGQYRLDITNGREITIGGNAPIDVGLSAGTLQGFKQTNTDLISVSYNPSTGATTPQTVSIDLSSSTQFASPFSITALTQNGFSTGRLTGVNVDATGIITASFGNGQSQQLGQVALANFRNPQGLASGGDTTWSETYSSGVALLGAPLTADLGLTLSGSLEDSNVQLTDELVGLIVAQRNFQANAQTIRTADAVTQTIINIR